MVRIGSGRTQPYVDNSNRVLAAPNRQNTLRPPEPMSAPDILPSSRYITVAGQISAVASRDRCLTARGEMADAALLKARGKSTWGAGYWLCTGK
jgi:hypothetical protein